MTTFVVDASVWVSAADSTDRFHAQSRQFMQDATRRKPRFLLPALARVEIGCALARRLGDEERARALVSAIFGTPLIQEKALDRKLLAAALDRGLKSRLRGADALYATVAGQAGCDLVSWDRDLLDRAGAIRPSDVF